MTTIAGLTPILVEGWSSERPSRNIIHTLLSSSDTVVNLRPAGLRTGTLRVLFGTLALAQELEDALAAGAVVTISDGEYPISMDFVAVGTIRVQLAEETKRHAWVEFEYAEVTS